VKGILVLCYFSEKGRKGGRKGERRKDEGRVEDSCMFFVDRISRKSGR
jgi:hypothetical protein